MWTLECDGAILEHKKIWLRPGKKYLFGRTHEHKGRDAGFCINEKSVSRKHITLSVSKVKPGDGSLVNTRSELALTDEGTKFGTTVDGEKIEGTRILKKNQHVFKLGKTTHNFTIRWQPVVLSFSFSSKDVKGGKDPLVAIRSRLEDLDIKTILPYLTEKTTHVVSSKRNTAKGLQALINAKYIVAESFIDALTFATTPGDLDEPESLSPLEEDFDAHWPNPMDHLPAKSKEPNERPKEFFKPNPERISIFEGYTFIFFDLIQFETLEDPIQNGGGKAYLKELNPWKTTREELVRFVKDKAGEKSLGEFEDGSVGKGVVLVRFRGKKEYQDWAVELGDQLAVAVNQRMIEQSEFMDAILENSAENFRKPLQEEDGLAPLSITTRPMAISKDPSLESTSQPEVSQQFPIRRRPRGPIQSRFKGFGDESDEEDFKSTPMDSSGNGSRAQTSTSLGRSQRVLAPHSIANSSSEPTSQELEMNTTQPNTSRKRSSPPSDNENEDDMVDQLLPAAAAMKRRKIEEQENFRRNGVSSEATSNKTQPKAETEKRRKPKKVNIQEVVRERREAEEEAARRDEESLRSTLDGMNIEEMKNLAVVEEMKLPDRSERHRRSTLAGPSNNRWHESWNGRKNFKKFRRRGESTQARRGQSVIVPLEEVKKKDFGIGEEYWLGSDEPKNKRKEKEHISQDLQSQSYISAGSQHEKQVPTELIIEDKDPAFVDVDVPRTTRRMDRASQLDDSNKNSQARNGKRPAPIGRATTPVAKKQKVSIPIEEEEESDSGDELRFRFKSRK